MAGDAYNPPGDMPTIHLIDASPYIFRAYFSLPDSIRTPQGTVMNAVYGFASFLLKYVGEEAPSHAAIAFDRSLTTSFRNEIYPAYKQQRELPPAELEAQLESCEIAARTLGFATFSDEIYEADDLIATVADQIAGPDRRFIIVTSDKDLAQLVSDTVELYDYGKGARLRASDVKNKMGVPPERVPDYLGLAGDSVDNIPGVKGVGPKTAAALLEIYGSIENLYEQIGSVGRCGLRGAMALQDRLQSQEREARLSKELATVSTASPIAVTLQELEYRGPTPEAEALFGRWGFGTIRERVSPGSRAQ